jgi:hypothetical protein
LLLLFSIWRRFRPWLERNSRSDWKRINWTRKKRRIEKSVGQQLHLLCEGDVGEIFGVRSSLIESLTLKNQIYKQKNNYLRLSATARPTDYVIITSYAPIGTSSQQQHLAADVMRESIERDTVRSYISFHCRPCRVTYCEGDFVVHNFDFQGCRADINKVGNGCARSTLRPSVILSFNMDRWIFFRLSNNNNRIHSTESTWLF